MFDMQIIRKVISDIGYVQDLPMQTFRALVPAYIATFQQVFGASHSTLACYNRADFLRVLGLAVSAVVLVLSIVSRSKKLPVA